MIKFTKKPCGMMWGKHDENGIWIPCVDEVIDRLEMWNSNIPKKERRLHSFDSDRLVGYGG